MVSPLDLWLVWCWRSVGDDWWPPERTRCYTGSRPLQVGYVMYVVRHTKVKKTKCELRGPQINLKVTTCFAYINRFCVNDLGDFTGRNERTDLLLSVFLEWVYNYKLEAFTQWWFHAGPASATLAQHETTTGSKPGRWWRAMLSTLLDQRLRPWPGTDPSLIPDHNPCSAPPLPNTQVSVVCAMMLRHVSWSPVTASFCVCGVTLRAQSQPINQSKTRPSTNNVISRKFSLHFSLRIPRMESLFLFWSCRWLISQESAAIIFYLFVWIGIIYDDIILKIEVVLNIPAELSAVKFNKFEASFSLAIPDSNEFFFFFF